jgi:hypothetical protein
LWWGPCVTQGDGAVKDGLLGFGVLEVGHKVAVAFKLESVLGPRTGQTGLEHGLYLGEGCRVEVILKISLELWRIALAAGAWVRLGKQPVIESHAGPQAMGS